MRNRVVVTGLGCVSPLANNWPETWKAMVAARSGVAAITRFDASTFKTRIAAEVKGFKAADLFGVKEARRMDPFTQYALAAVLEALSQSSLAITDGNRNRIGVVIGTGVGGMSTVLEQYNILKERGPERISPFLIPMMLPDTASSTVAIKLGIRGPNMAVITACATGSNAIGEATEMIRRGIADVVISGSTEAAILPISIAGMGAMTALSTRNEEPEHASRPFDLNRDGFVMGEGAGVLVLESLEYARQRSANILAEITGYGTSNDAYHMSAPAESGAGAALCMHMALEDAGLQPGDVDYINAHGTSTPLNDKSETTAIKTIFGEHAYKVPISSTKSMVGHLMGASGSLEAVVCVQVLQDGLLPPTINYETPDPDCDLDYVPNKARRANVRHVMSNSFGFGGHNATLIISRYEE